MHSIERKIASITEDRRAAYLFDTKKAADAVGCHPRKFSDWWFRNKAKLTALFMAQPGETAAELAGLIAEAAAELERAKGRNDEVREDAKNHLPSGRRHVPAAGGGSVR